MEYIPSLFIVLGFTVSIFIQRFIFKKFESQVLKSIKETSDKISVYHNIQSQNTVKSTDLLQKIFVTTADEKLDPRAPNEVTKSNSDEIEFSEQNMFTLPKDLKFEIEGGDSNIPTGFKEKSN